MILVYIAGPFRASTSWDIAQNVRCAERVGLEVAHHGYYPVIPHSMTHHFHGAIDDEFWLNGSLALMLRCDGVLAMDKWGCSEGSRREIDTAIRANIAVRYGVDCLVSNPIEKRGASK